MIFRKNVPLAPFSTFGIGGEAEWFVTVDTLHDMREALNFATAKDLPYYVIGKGSNCLFDDSPFEGLIIQNKLNQFEARDDGIFYIGSGYSFARLGSTTSRLGWSGLEFASGIPGTVGGAIYMNAGANGADTSQKLLEVEYLHSDGKLEIFNKENLQFSYRTSPFQKMRGAIVGAQFQLSCNPKAKTMQHQMLSYRTATQPYGQKSAGCIFRNPEKASAGALIEQAGLKGYSIGGAEVSPQHANFIINSGKATARDVLDLMEHIKQIIKKRYDIELLSEVCYISSISSERKRCPPHGVPICTVIPHVPMEP